MAIYYVSLVLTAPPNYDEQAVVWLLREAISMAVCRVVFERWVFPHDTATDMALLARWN